MGGRGRGPLRPMSLHSELMCAWFQAISCLETASVPAALVQFRPPIKRTRKDDAASWRTPDEMRLSWTGMWGWWRPRNLLQIRFTPWTHPERDWESGWKSHHARFWEQPPSSKCLIFGHKCCRRRRVADFKIEFTIWIELPDRVWAALLF